MKKMDYSSVMSRKSEILKNSTGIDYQQFETSALAFDYEGLLSSPGYSIDKIRSIQAETGVGDTPLVELKRITSLIRSISPPGKGARIFVKDERANPSGSFKDRRASLSVYHSYRLGYRGVIAATSGNYGAAVASQAAKFGLKAIIVQEVYDSRHVGQPEILEKTRACEAYGAEVWQMSVGPELFYMLLRMLEETGFYSASLYTPTSVLGIETLGYELALQTKKRFGKFPDAVIVTHAGGGNVTGTARGLMKAGSPSTQVIGASVDLKGIHMASDEDFNRKSFTTGHSGFGVPFLTWPDRTDVPRNCARALRYLDSYVLVTQGDVFFVTELLSRMEGLQRGPAGNTSLTAALSIAQKMEQDKIIVVQETEYTGAGKLPTSQLTFARQNRVEVRSGDPKDNCPGRTIVIPERVEQIKVEAVDLDKIRESYIQNAKESVKDYEFQEIDLDFLAEDSRSTLEFVKQVISSW